LANPYKKPIRSRRKPAAQARSGGQAALEQAVQRQGIELSDKAHHSSSNATHAPLRLDKLRFADVMPILLLKDHALQVFLDRFIGGVTPQA
jgi:hypothetical protein